MGRRKPGKPRREQRDVRYSLRQLEPPGYERWLTPAVGVDPDALAADPTVSAEAVDLLRRLLRLRPVYGKSIPQQAIVLDQLVDVGTLPLQRPDGEVIAVPVGELAARMGRVPAGDVRGHVHELHSYGMILVGEHQDLPAPVVRLVVGKPAKPGEPWLFGGDIASDLVPKACIPVDPATMSPAEFSALAYLRAHLSEGTTGTVEEYAGFNGVGTVKRAQELFDAVAHLVDVRGCPSCPTAHLCTRDKNADRPPRS
ncbi:hypothetical protein ACWCYY_35135 [Kitasatospora sp. NPDC001664]